MTAAIAQATAGRARSTERASGAPVYRSGPTTDTAFAVPLPSPLPLARERESLVSTQRPPSNRVREGRALARSPKRRSRFGCGGAEGAALTKPATDHPRSGGHGGSTSARVRAAVRARCGSEERPP